MAKSQLYIYRIIVYNSTAGCLVFYLKVLTCNCNTLGTDCVVNNSSDACAAYQYMSHRCGSRYNTMSKRFSISQKKVGKPHKDIF